MEFYNIEDESVPVQKRRYLILIIYDVTDDKRRQKLVKCLNSYGCRVQESAFECILTNNLYKKIINETEKIIKKEDSLRIYRLTGLTQIRCWDDIGEIKYQNNIFV